MSTATKYEIKSISSEHTAEIGERIGNNLKGNELIILISDLGGGKTTITKGIVKGAGSKDLASSPSFTLSNEYRTSNYSLVHYDFYRLNEPGVLLDSIIEDINDDNKVVIVEWPDIVLNNLPTKKVVITIQAVSESNRIITIQVNENLNYIIEGIE